MSKLFLNCRFLLRMWYYYFCFLLTVTIYLKVELLKCLVSVVQECNRLGKKVPHFKTLSNEHSANRDTKVEINGLHLGILNWFATGVSRKHKLRVPNEAFFHWNPELLGFGRQIWQINSGAFWVIFGQTISTHFS